MRHPHQSYKPGIDSVAVRGRYEKHSPAVSHNPQMASTRSCPGPWPPPPSTCYSTTPASASPTGRARRACPRWRQESSATSRLINAQPSTEITHPICLGGLVFERRYGLNFERRGQLREAVRVRPRLVHRAGRRREPDAECQLDFARMGMLFDQSAGCWPAAHMLILTAVYSRHMFLGLTTPRPAPVAVAAAPWAGGSSR